MFKQPQHCRRPPVRRGSSSSIDRDVQDGLLEDLRPIPSYGGADDVTVQSSAKGHTDAGRMSLASWYMHQLEAHELRTKFVSSAVLALVGDVCAQIVVQCVNAKGAAGCSCGGGIHGAVALARTLDRRRMVAMFADGLMCMGPMLHYVYELYERILPTRDKNGEGDDDRRRGRRLGDPSSSSRHRLFAATLAHVLFDNFVMAIGYIAVMMLATGVMEGRGASAVVRELRVELFPAVKVSWRVSVMGYIPFQLLSFQLLPRKLRVLAVNVFDVIWITVMSYVTHRNRH